MAEDKKTRKRRLRREQMRRYRTRKKENGLVLRYVSPVYSTKRLCLKLRPKRRRKK